MKKLKLTPAVRARLRIIARNRLALDYNRFTVMLGDCIELMRSLPDHCVDSVVCDPPYGIEFMGSEFDTFKANAKNANASLKHVGDDRPEPVNLTADSARLFQKWCQIWAKEALRVLKPGGYLLASGGTRMYHRLTCGIEDAGFEIRDSIRPYGHEAEESVIQPHVLDWLYASGFPKSLNVSLAIDKAAGAERAVVGPAPYKRGRSNQQYSETRRVSYDYEAQPVTSAGSPEAAEWEGFGTALKPAREPFVVARAPLIGTVAANVLKHGTGALNIDGSRVATSTADKEQMLQMSQGFVGRDFGKPEMMNYGYVESMPKKTLSVPAAGGRWPANVILLHHPACVEVGVKSVKGGNDPRRKDGTVSNKRSIYQPHVGGYSDNSGYADADGKETIPDFRCHPDCHIAALSRQSGVRPSTLTGRAPHDSSLKPAREPIVVARAPLIGAVAVNVLKHGTGALNIDGSRVPTGRSPAADRRESSRRTGNAPVTDRKAAETEAEGKIGRRGSADVYSAERPSENLGRWPANIILLHHPACVEVGVKSVKSDGHTPAKRGVGGLSTSGHKGQDNVQEKKSGKETIPDFRCHPDCHIAALSRQSGIRHGFSSGGAKDNKKSGTEAVPSFNRKPSAAYLKNDTGTASRFFHNFHPLDGVLESADPFFYCPKVSTAERNAGMPAGERSIHPTVKPVALMRHLVRLVTPPGGLVLDPFCGSGSTGIAAVLEGFRFLGMEQSAEYRAIALARIEHWANLPANHPAVKKTDPSRARAGKPEALTGGYVKGGPPQQRTGLAGDTRDSKSAGMSAATSDPNAPCPAPHRNGDHEWYLHKSGTREKCRACGVRRDVPASEAQPAKTQSTAVMKRKW